MPNDPPTSAVLDAPPAAAPVIRSDDEWITQREAAKALRVSFPSISRYMTCGAAGLVLPSLAVGRRRYTTQEAIDWFCTALQVRDNARRAAQWAAGGSGPTAESQEVEAAADAAGL